MPIDVIVALIYVMPRVLWILVGVTLLVLFYRPIRDQLIPRMSGLSLFGVEASFLRETMDRAISKRSAPVSDGDRARALRRLRRLPDAFKGARILWLDESPEGQSDEREMLRCTGARVEKARSGDDARRMLGDARYDAIVAAEQRGGKSAEAMIGAAGILPPVIVYACDGGAARATPAGVFAVADRPDELLHCIADALERARI